jgi:hypothetical protein
MPTIEATTVTSMMAMTTSGSSCNKSIALSIDEDETHDRGRLEKGSEIYESQLAFEAEKPDWPPPHQQLQC